MTFIDLNIDCTTFVKSFKINFHRVIKLSIHLLGEKAPIFAKQNMKYMCSMEQIFYKRK